MVEELYHERNPHDPTEDYDTKAGWDCYVPPTAATSRGMNQGGASLSGWCQCPLTRGAGEIPPGWYIGADIDERYQGFCQECRDHLA